MSGLAHALLARTWTAPFFAVVTRDDDFYSIPTETKEAMLPHAAGLDIETACLTDVPRGPEEARENSLVLMPLDRESRPASQGQARRPGHVRAPGRPQYEDFLAHGGGIEHLARVYLGMVRNSNWYRPPDASARH